MPETVEPVPERAKRAQVSEDALLVKSIVLIHRRWMQAVGMVGSDRVGVALGRSEALVNISTTGGGSNRSEAAMSSQIVSCLSRPYADRVGIPRTGDTFSCRDSRHLGTLGLLSPSGIRKFPPVRRSVMESYGRLCSGELK